MESDISFMPRTAYLSIATAAALFFLYNPETSEGRTLEIRDLGIHPPRCETDPLRGD